MPTQFEIILSFHDNIEAQNSELYKSIENPLDINQQMKLSDAIKSHKFE